MAKKSKSKAIKTKAAKQTEIPAPAVSPNAPWISMRTGLVLVAIASVAMAVLTAIEAVKVKGTLVGILYGVMFGGLIWIIFFGNILINRLLRRKKS